ncbi:MAG: phosphatidylserine decarboxylase [Rhodospirillaceae bacterium]
MIKIRIHPKGWPFIIFFAAVTSLLFSIAGWTGQILGSTGAVLTIWCAYFFRDPHRITPIGPDLVISPADGVVQSVKDCHPPDELGMKTETMRRVSVFMNVFDCHVNRSPVDGKIRNSAYYPGKFFNASLDKASVENERRSLRILLKDETEIAVVQIAGLIARRIISWVPDGADIRAGERFGMIRFGSRVDVYLPSNSTVLVVEGQKAVAGETVIARLNSEDEDRKGEVR